MVDLDDRVGDAVRCAELVDSFALGLEQVVVVGDQRAAGRELW